MKKQKVYFFLALIFGSQNIFSQNDSENICGESQQKWKHRVEEKVRSFESLLQNISSEKNMKLKRTFSSQACDMFVSKAKIEVANLKQNTLHTYPIKAYLDSVVGKYNLRYSVVKIKFVSIKVDEIREVFENGEIFWKGNYHYVQTFCASKKGELTVDQNNEIHRTEFIPCLDVTEKEGEFTIKKIATQSGTVCVLKFDDINVEAINPLEK